MRGHLRERSPGHWAIVIDVRDPQTGKRKRKWHSFKGTKREAQMERAKLIASIGKGDYIEPSKTTVADFVRSRIDQWEASTEISARTAQRYRQLLSNQIEPHIGAMALRKLRPLHIEQWHSALRGTCASRTVGHAARVLSKALADAQRNDLVTRNVAREVPPPRAQESERVIVRDVPALVAELPRWRHSTVAMVALFTGMRLGEVLALRWSCVDLDRQVIKVREALEQTGRFGVRFKSPKSKAGTRNITLPDVLVAALREHRKTALELRLQLGAGRLPDDALLFASIDGQPLKPNQVSVEWINFARDIGMPDVTFHSLRHTHASALIAAGVDIATIAARLGHARPNVTLQVYAHLFAKDDSKAAAAINSMQW
jgi:integrase